MSAGMMGKQKDAYMIATVPQDLGGRGAMGTNADFPTMGEVGKLTVHLAAEAEQLLNRVRVLSEKLTGDPGGYPAAPAEVRNGAEPAEPRGWIAQQHQVLRQIVRALDATGHVLGGLERRFG